MIQFLLQPWNTLENSKEEKSVIFTHVFTFHSSSFLPDSPFFFFLNHFLSISWTSFRHSFRVVLLVIHYLSFLSSENVWIFPFLPPLFFWRIFSLSMGFRVEHFFSFKPLPSGLRGSWWEIYLYLNRLFFILLFKLFNFLLFSLQV